MNKLFVKSLCATLACALSLLASSYCWSDSSISSQNKTPVVITDIESWHHPVKDVLKKNSVLLSKVELKNNRKYAIFHVKFPYDPQSSVNDALLRKLYVAILDANGWWGYEMQDNEDQITIKVTANKKNKRITVDVIPLGQSSAQ